MKSQKEFLSVVKKNIVSVRLCSKMICSCRVFMRMLNYNQNYRLIKGSPEWIIMAEVIPEDVLVVDRKFAENTENMWNQDFWGLIEEDG